MDTKKVKSSEEIFRTDLYTSEPSSNNAAVIYPQTRKKIEKEAVTETVKENIKQKKEHVDKLQNLANRGRISLYRICAVFPFDFFPDEISIEPDQINICIKSFFRSGKSYSIPIKNIADVYLYTSFMFASLKIIDTSYIENSVEVPFLRKKEAEKARRIIQGLILASKEGVDLSKIEPKKLIEKAEEIGKMQGVEIEM